MFRRHRRWSLFNFRPPGLVYLIFRNETKRALLPNEVTSLDTVRALFVRSFSDSLSLAMLESPHRKIYVMDPQTNLYYELEDLRDIKDRCVLKIYETDPRGSANGVSRSPSRSPKMHARSSYSGTSSGHDSDSSVRSGPTMPPRSPSHHQRPFNHEQFSQKTQSLPIQPNYIYQQQMGHYAVPSQYGTNPMQAQYAGSPTHVGMQYRQPDSNHNSPQRVPHTSGIPPNQRHSVAYLPDPNVGFQSNPIPQSRSYHDYYDGQSSRSGSATPTASESETKSRMEKMEAQLANLTAWVQTAVVQQREDDSGGSRPGSSRSNHSLVSDNSAKSSLSDISCTTPKAMLGMDMQNSLRDLHVRARQLKEDCRTLRRQQINFQDTVRETINDTYRKIKEALPGVPGASELPLRAHRLDAANQTHEYRTDASEIDKELSDLEASVEELRSDVLNKGCRVNSAEVETMALALSNISKKLGELKTRFPQLHDRLKSVMAGEMEVVVQEERLATIQEANPPQPINMATTLEDYDENRRAVLDNIHAVNPNHQARLQSLEAAEESRERKKMLVVNQDKLRMEKNLEIAQKQLKETNIDEDYQPVVPAERPTDGVLPIKEQGHENGTLLRGDKGSPSKGDANIPLTDTTKRLSLVSAQVQEIEKAVEGMKLDGGKILRPPEEFANEGQPNTDESADAPPKPPRTMEHDSETNGDVKYVAEVVEVKSPNTPVTNGPTHNGTNDSQFSTFSATVVSTKPVSQEPSINSSISSDTSLSKLPMPTSTSTPISANGRQNHVTFAPTVTEIQANTAARIIKEIDGGGGGKKKIPPPPPPRRSSRMANQSPTDAQPARSFSPPAYENIEDLKIGENAVNEKGNCNDGDNAKLPTFTKNPQNGVVGQKEGKKIPHPILIHPDRGSQKFPAGDQNAALLSDTPSDTDSSTSSESNPHHGVVLRRVTNRPDVTSTENSHQKDVVVLREVKKVPPPPPVRRTSALSNVQRQTISEIDEVAKPSDLATRPLSNGERVRVHIWDNMV